MDPQLYFTRIGQVEIEFILILLIVFYLFVDVICKELCVRRIDICIFYDTKLNLLKHSQQ